MPLDSVSASSFDQDDEVSARKRCLIGKAARLGQAENKAVAALKAMDGFPFGESKFALDDPNDLAHEEIGFARKIDSGALRKNNLRQIERQIGGRNKRPSQIAAFRIAPDGLIFPAAKPAAVPLGPR